MSAQVAEFTLDLAGRQLFKGDRPLHLSPKAFDVLRVLVERRPNAVSKSDLYQLVWPDTFVADASLTMVVTEIRRALGDEAQHPRFVRTVHRFGYAFCGPLEVSAPMPDTASMPPAWFLWNGRTLVLRSGQNLVGRDPACDVWLDAAGVSRRHARVSVAGGAATLEDLGSKNGTLLRDREVTGPTPLVDGDVVHLGSTEVQFRLGSRSRATETIRIARR